MIKSFSNIGFSELFKAFNEAFIDYEMQLNEVQLKTMLIRRGFVPELSFGQFLNNRIIAFTFNGIGIYEDHKTAYDTGTGTIKEYRGQGHATKIFEHSLPFLKDAGVSQYLLEVLQHNTKAVSIYKKLDFEISREFNYFLQKVDKIRFNNKTKNLNTRTKAIALEEIEPAIEFCDFNPSWQNSFEAIRRTPSDFKIIGTYLNQILAGYCIFEPDSGDITQIAINKEYRRQGLGTHLLKEALKFNKHESVKIVNTETSCKTITAFLESNSFPVSGKQFEMIKQL